MTTKLPDTASADTDVRPQGPSADTKEGGSVSDRLRAALRQAGGNKAVSQRAKVPTTTIDGALQAGSMRLQTAVQLAEATGVTLEWLATGRGPMRPGETLAAPPEPQENPGPQPSPRLQDVVEPDRLAIAYVAATQALAKRGNFQPTPRQIVEMMCAVYDALTIEDAAK